MRVLPVVFLLSMFASCGNNTVLKEHTVIPSYPSASGIEYLNDKLYVIGDDANKLLVLDKELKPLDSIALYSFPGQRIPKDIKADLESAAITADNKLLLLGSGSLAPYRNRAWLIDPVTKQKDSINLDLFFKYLGDAGIPEVNIEGMTSVPGNMVLANRGNKNYPKNFLVVTGPDFWKKPESTPITLIAAGADSDTSHFNGISGLAYAKSSDRLLLTVSTEDTRNAMEDGAIGKSYLWIIKNFSSKKRWKAINPDRVIDLQSVDPIFKGQKIESVCITKETRNFLYIVLAADNDNGSSSFFRMVVEKE
jgi:hypothetical protein